MTQYEASQIEFPYIDQDEDIDELFMRREILKWKEAAIALKEAEYNEDQAREKLVKALQFLGYNKLESHGIKAERIVRKGSIEYKAIPELHGVDLEPYRRPELSYWSIKPSLED